MSKLESRHVQDSKADFWVVWHPKEPSVLGVGPTHAEAALDLTKRETETSPHGSVIVLSALGDLLVVRLRYEEVRDNPIGYGETLSEAVADFVGCTDPEIRFAFESNLQWTAYKGDVSRHALDPRVAYQELVAALSEQPDKELIGGIIDRIRSSLGTGATMALFNKYVNQQEKDTDLLIKVHRYIAKLPLGKLTTERMELCEEIDRVIKRRTR